MTLEPHGRAAEGLRARQRARELTPEAPDVNSAYLFALNTSNATLEEIADEHRRWGSEFVRITGGAPTPHDHVKDPARRLRVGYVSADLREHAVAFFMAPILAHHDASVVEVYCYVNQHRSDHTSSQLRRYAHHWTSLSDSSDEAAAERIGNDGIDILVDLSGYTAGGRLGVFARQAAPIQVTYLGYPNTTGLPTMQYRITDRWADPPGRTEHLHSELLLRLPHSFLCYAPPSDSPAVAERSSAERGAVTFGSFNRGRKLSESTISLWSRILVALPEARILLKPGPIDRAELRDRFARQGVAADRIDLLDYSPGIPGHLDAYRAVDIALDSFPYNGTTTTCEALWMGVPVITLAGPDHRSRVGASLLRNVGLPEFIAESGDAYVECAQQLAQDAQRLRTLRASLRERMLRSALMDGKRFTQDLEAAYRTIWTEWCSETGRR
ncbi:MAG TPA: hypothetical protein VHC69_09230 [Polyangiaceae bacterium]|nr:hypothetical protein [Polyangiaceae bacterium]